MTREDANTITRLINYVRRDGLRPKVVFASTDPTDDWWAVEVYDDSNDLVVSFYDVSDFVLSALATKKVQS
jgi:hypothetical protein